MYTFAQLIHTITLAALISGAVGAALMYILEHSRD